MKTTFKPQSTNKKETKMNTQSDKERKMKSKIITIFLGMVFLLAGGGLLVGYDFGGEVMGPALMFLFALCCFGITIWSKKNWWAVIPGGIFASLGVVGAMEILIPHSEVTGPVFLSLFAATFIVVVILSKKNWWSLIPGGIFASLGLVAVLEILIPHEEYPSLPNTLSLGVYTWVLFLGLAATFGALWLLHKTQSTDWAKYPAAGLLAIAVLAFILGSRFQVVWPATVMLGIGVMFLLTIFTRKKLPSVQQTPKVRA
jgi:hypothetical protein